VTHALGILCASRGTSTDATVRDVIQAVEDGDLFS
jgi:hypothetical protein